MSLLIPSILKQVAAGGGGGGGIAYESIGDIIWKTALEHTTTSESVDMPSGIVNGDILVAIVGYRVVTDPTFPAGWTERTTSSSDHGAWGFGVSIATHVVTDAGSEPGSITIGNLTADRAVSAVIVRLSGGTSWDAAAGDISTSVTDHVSPDVTPTASSGLILQVACFPTSGAYTVTSPATNILTQDSTTGNNICFGVSYVASSGTSSQGGATFTTNVSKGAGLVTLAFH